MAQPDLLYMLLSRHYANDRELRDLAAEEIKRLRATNLELDAIAVRLNAEIERLRADKELNDRLLNEALQLRDDARQESKQLQEQLHYANGTCELAMRHRDSAEAEVADLRDLLRQCQHLVVNWQLSEDIRHALKLGCQQETS